MVFVGRRGQEDVAVRIQQDVALGLQAAGDDADIAACLDAQVTAAAQGGTMLRGLLVPVPGTNGLTDALLL